MSASALVLGAAIPADTALESPSADPDAFPKPLPNADPLPNAERFPNPNRDTNSDPSLHHKRGYWQNTNYVGYSEIHNANCRTCPWKNCTLVHSYLLFEPVVFSCQARGENVEGNDLWDYTVDGCYVADIRVRTKRTFSVDEMPLCGS